MAEEFNKSMAAERHSEIIREIERVRDGISQDIVGYYRSAPSSEEEERSQRAGMRKYLQIAQDRIRQLLDGKLG